MPNNSTIYFGSPEYHAEVARIMEKEAYGVKTNAEWNRLNERTLMSPWARFKEQTGLLLILIGAWIMWLASIGASVSVLLKTFDLIQ